MFALSLVSTVHSKSEAEVHRAARNQTHAVEVAGCGEMTHRAPLVLFRVVQEHLVRPCRPSGVKITLEQYCPALTSYHEPSIVQCHSSESLSCLGQAGHHLPGTAPLLLQGLGRCQAGSLIPAPGYYIHLQNECKYQHQSSILSFVQWS